MDQEVWKRHSRSEGLLLVLTLILPVHFLVLVAKNLVAFSKVEKCARNDDYC
jgi:hypothetical protein